MAYFPNFVMWAFKCKQEASRKPLPTNKKISLRDALEDLYKDRFYEPHLFLNSYHDEGVADDESYTIAVNPQLRETMLWITKHILTTIGKDTYLTINVYIRIGTSMLNKLVDNGVISKELGIYYHDNMVANTADLISELSLEELPF